MQISETKLSRVAWPNDIVFEVLTKSRRRCALCVGLLGDTQVKKGQIAHIDQKSANSTLENAMFLCFTHHEEYDSSSKQAKQLTPDELRYYRQRLYDQLGDPNFLWLPPPVHISSKKVGGVSLAEFDRRIPVYRATMAYLVAILKLNNIEMKDIWEFGRAMDEALFLFDDDIADYLTDLYKRGLRLQALSLMIQAPEQRTSELIQEHTDLALWFTGQFEEARRRFTPFLRLK